MALKALLFDVDGTLADTEPQGHLPAYNLAFSEMGLDWHWNETAYRELLLQPGGRERLYHFITEHSPNLGAYAQEAAADTQAFVNKIHAVKSRYFYDLVKAGSVPLRPGIRRLMKAAHEAGCKVGIVTNASAASLKPFLAYTLTDGLMDCVDAVISGEQVTNKKPAPDLYLAALEQLGVNASDCVAIEDSAMGHNAAHSAGIPVLITLNDDTRHHAFPHAAMIVENLGEPDCEGQGKGKGEGEGEHVDLNTLETLLAKA